MRAAIYSRISQDANGERLGVTRQVEDGEALADKLGWDVTARYDDNDLSAFTGKVRPGYEAMLEAMTRREFDAVICWHPDRLYRSMKDLERLIDIADVAKVALRTVNGGDIDLSNSSGRMIARILGSVARQESEHKGERQQRANEQHRAAGEWNRAGQRPFGYTKEGQPLEPEATMVRRAATDVLAGKSLRSIAIAWNKAGITSTRGSMWTNLGVRRLLLNPLNAALVTYRGQVLGSGKWEALIEEGTHRGLVAFLSDPSRKPAVSFERKHQGSGIYICGICGNRLYASFPHGSGRKMTYLCRPSSHIARIGSPLDLYIETLVLSYLSGNDVGADLAETKSKVDLDALRTHRAAVEAQQVELAGMWTAHEIDGNQFRKASGDLKAQLAEIDAVMAEAARVSPVALLVGDPDEPLLQRWEDALPDIKGKVIAELMDVVVHPAPRGARTFDPDLIEIRWQRPVVK